MRLFFFFHFVPVFAKKNEGYLNQNMKTLDLFILYIILYSWTENKLSKVKLVLKSSEPYGATSNTISRNRIVTAAASTDILAVIIIIFFFVNVNINRNNFFFVYYS